MLPAKFAFAAGDDVLSARVDFGNLAGHPIIVKDSELTFQLINPYWKTLADRNLKVQQLHFTPDPAP